MRTTLDLDDAVLEAARSVAARTKRSIGAVVSEWAQLGSAAAQSGKPRKRSRLPMFDLPPDSPPIDSAMVKRLLDDEGLSP